MQVVKEFCSTRASTRKLVKSSREEVWGLFAIASGEAYSIALNHGMKQEAADSSNGARLPLRRKREPELVFGIVAAVGSDQDLVCRALEDALGYVDYSSKQIRLSAFLRELKEWSAKLA